MMRRRRMRMRMMGCHEEKIGKSVVVAENETNI